MRTQGKLQEAIRPTCGSLCMKHGGAEGSEGRDSKKNVVSDRAFDIVYFYLN